MRCCSKATYYFVIRVALHIKMGMSFSSVEDVGKLFDWIRKSSTLPFETRG